MLLRGKTFAIPTNGSRTRGFSDGQRSETEMIDKEAESSLVSGPCAALQESVPPRFLGTPVYH